MFAYLKYLLKHKWFVYKFGQQRGVGLWQLHPHHWEYWVLLKGAGGLTALEMPKKYVLEMLADWDSAGYCLKGRVETLEWYEDNKDKIIFNPETRKLVEGLLYGTSQA